MAWGARPWCGLGSVLAQMQQRMKRDLDGELMHKWMAARESITCEAQHVREIAQVSDPLIARCPTPRVSLGGAGAASDARRLGSCHLHTCVQVISQFKEALPAVIAGPPGAKGPPVRAGTIGAKHVAASRYACAHPPLVTLLRTRDAFTMMLRRDALPLPWPRSAARARALAAVRGGRTWAA